MIIFGASGHGKVISSIFEKEVNFFFDDDSSITKFVNREVLTYDSALKQDEKIIVAIGNNHIRKKVVDRVKHNFGTAIHSTAVVDRSVLIGDGSQLVHNSIIQAGTIIGEHCIINTGASIDHDCTIGDFCHIAPGATLCGNVTIGEGTLIGAGSTIIPGIKIGQWCTIGAGTVVINDVPDNAMVVGNPGKIIKVMEL